jgi:PAS domain S-box-containing protein
MKKNDLVMLYVEDDEQLQNTYTRFFKRRVSELHLANNGQVGLAKFKELKPDLVVSDLRMPVMDGIEMITNIREIDDEVTIIVTSAFNDSEYLSKAIELGVSRYLNKPFNREQITKVFQKAIDYVLLKKREAEQQKTLSSIFEISFDGIAIIDKDGKFLNINQSYLDLIGYSKDETLELSIFDLSEKDDFEKIKAIFENKEEDSFDKICINKENKKLNVNMAFKKINSNGNILVRAKDIT